MSTDCDCELFIRRSILNLPGAGKKSEKVGSLNAKHIMTIFHPYLITSALKPVSASCRYVPFQTIKYKKILSVMLSPDSYRE
jgi:hypothetical protein